MKIDRHALTDLWKRALKRDQTVLVRIDGSKRFVNS